MPLSARYSHIIAISKQSDTIKLFVDLHYLLLSSWTTGLLVKHCLQWSANLFNVWSLSGIHLPQRLGQGSEKVFC